MAQVSIGPLQVELILETKKHILEKFLQGMLADKPVKVKGSGDSQEDSANEPDRGQSVQLNRALNLSVNLWRAIYV